MKQHNKSTGIKYMAKTIFSLKRELDSQSNNIQLIQQVTQEIKGFMISKKYDIRSYKQLTQIYKYVQDQEFALTIFPRSKPLREKQKKVLALHELDRFDEYFNYKKLDDPALKHEEEARREDIINSRLDTLNPLGLDLFAQSPVQVVLTIQTPQLDQVMLLTILISYGGIEFKDLSVFDNVNLRQEWHTKLLDIVEEYTDAYRADVLDLSDSLQIYKIFKEFYELYKFHQIQNLLNSQVYQPFQSNIVKYLNSFGFEAQDAYYLELLAILSEQNNYMNWLNDLHNIVLANQMHSA